MYQSQLVKYCADVRADLEVSGAVGCHRRSLSGFLRFASTLPMGNIDANARELAEQLLREGEPLGDTPTGETQSGLIVPNLGNIAIVSFELPNGLVAHCVSLRQDDFSPIHRSGHGVYRGDPTIIADTAGHANGVQDTAWDRVLRADSAETLSEVAVDVLK